MSSHREEMRLLMERLEQITESLHKQLEIGVPEIDPGGRNSTQFSDP